MTPNTDTPKDISNAIDNEILTIVEFIKAWGIPLSIISERLRQSGYIGMDINIIKSIKEAKCLEERQSYLLQIALMEIRSDLDKTLGSLTKMRSHRFLNPETE